MPWWIASIISNVAIIWTEYQNRNALGGWVSVLPITGPAILVAQYCLFRAFNDAPHWFLAWVVFTVGNSIMRVSAVGFFGDKVGNWPLALTSITIMIGAAFMMKTALK